MPGPESCPRLVVTLGPDHPDSCIHLGSITQKEQVKHGYYMLRGNVPEDFPSLLTWAAPKQKKNKKTKKTQGSLQVCVGDRSLGCCLAQKEGGRRMTPRSVPGS